MLIEKPSIEDILSYVDSLKIHSNDIVLLYIGEHANLDYPHLIELLNQKDINFVGAIFPGIIYHTKSYNDAIIIKKWATLAKPFLIRGIDGEDFDIPDFGIINDDIYSDLKASTLILVDGLTANICTLLFQLYNQLSNSVNYIGGGAGSLSLQQQPCLLTNSGFYQDAAIVLFLENQASLSVQHGWEKLEGPIVATQTEKNIIKQLNWQNAFEIYKSVVEQDSGKQFNDENFFDIAKGYPFGMYRENEEDVVRDPIVVTEDGALVCVGEVPENTILYILKGIDEKLISAAQKAANESLAGVEILVKDVFIVDCISRVLFLQDDFDKELEAVSRELAKHNELTTIHGILSLGEISSKGGLLEFFNKTMVVGAFY